MKLNFHLIKGSLVGALGGLLFGFDTAVIAGTTHALTLQYDLTPRSLGLTVSIALWCRSRTDFRGHWDPEPAPRRDSSRWFSQSAPSCCSSSDCWSLER